MVGRGGTQWLIGRRGVKEAEGGRLVVVLARDRVEVNLDFGALGA